MSVRDIAEKANCVELTVKKLIAQYLDNNGDVRDGRTYGQGRVIPDEVQTFVLLKETLRQTAHMSLPLKCQYIERMTGHLLTKQQLQALFWRNKIRYIGVNSQSHAAYRDAGLDLRRQEFCVQIGDKLVNDSPTVFMDETTVKLSYIIKKAWMPTTCRVMVPCTTYPDEVVTIYGALSKATKTPIMWFMSRSTNKEDFLKFCRKIRKNLKPQFANEHVDLVLDNHSAHSNYWSLRRLSWKICRLNPIFTPDNSSWLNPAEFIWAHLKRIYRYNLAELRLV